MSLRHCRRPWKCQPPVCKKLENNGLIFVVKPVVNDHHIPKSRPIRTLLEMIDADTRMHNSLAFHVSVEISAEIWPRLEKLEERQIGISHDIICRLITLLGVPHVSTTGIKQLIKGTVCFSR